MNGVVKKHELTREDKEQDRIHHVDVCDANTGPIYLACKYPQELLDLMETWKASHDAVYDFVAEDEIGHRVWVIDGEVEKKVIAEQFGNIPVYIYCRWTPQSCLRSQSRTQEERGTPGLRWK